ncbi:MAG: thiamine pyrophosphate-binding protein [Bacteroidota bacterium]
MKKTIWHKVLEDTDQLPEGRVMTVQAGNHDICLTHFEGKFCALDNKCPHQGGPLGEGSIENGLLRCPWHGWDYHPCTGKAPGYDDGVQTFQTKVKDGVVYVAREEEEVHIPSISDVMIETMVNWGIDTVFGMVGHSNLGVADAFRIQEAQGKLRYIGIRHEGAASFAASAYGKITGRPAACFAIAGPGSTNMYTGMWDAHVDRSPLLALTGQVATQVVGTGNFQELDLVAAFSAVAKFNHRVQKDSKHGELMSLAVKHAILNRNVSHLTFPDEVQFTPAGNSQPASSDHRISSLAIHPPTSQLDHAIHMIQKARRPVIIVGHGARFHMEGVIAIGQKLNCPILTTFKGKGQIPDAHPLSGGVLGRSGTPVASWFMNEADLLIVFGASFSNHTGITPKVPTIQIDYDPLTLAKFHAVEGMVYGELSVTCKLIHEALGADIQVTDQREELAERWKIWRTEKRRRMGEYRGKGLGAVHVFEALNRLIPAHAAIAVDVGNNTYSFGRYFEPKDNPVVMSGYLGSIGFALPASIGLWAAVGHERPILAVAGDGGLGQYLAEFTTLVNYNLPVKVLILNNQELGKISKEQRGIDLDVYHTHLTNPDFAAYAASCGGLGLKVRKPEEMDEQMKRFFAHEGPALLEVHQDVGLL